LDHEKRIAETKPLHGKLMDRWEVVTVRWVAVRWWKIVRMNSTSTRTRCDGKLDHELRPRKRNELITKPKCLMLENEKEVALDEDNEQVSLDRIVRETSDLLRVLGSSGSCGFVPTFIYKDVWQEIRFGMLIS
jgi:hypothetical protein